MAKIKGGGEMLQVHLVTEIWTMLIVYHQCPEWNLAE